MKIDQAFLEQSLSNIKIQREQALVLIGKCDGAAEIVEQLIRRLNAPEPPESPNVIEAKDVVIEGVGTLEDVLAQKT